MHLGEANPAALPDQPLDADACVRVALNRSPRMQMQYAQLGLQQADVYDATRLSNPSLSFMHADVQASDATRSTWGLSQNFTELLFINYRSKLGRSIQLQAQQQMASAVLNLEAEVRTAYYRYVVASLVAQLHGQSSLAARTAADYAKSLFDAGNISELQLSREQANASQARIDLQAVQADAEQKQGALLTLMGLSVHDSYKLLDRLNVPAAQSLKLDELQPWAERQRIDMAVLNERISMLGSVRTHTRHWFWLSDTRVQLERERDTDGSILNSVGGAVGVPLFNQGGGARLRAQANLEMAQTELSALRLSVANELAFQLSALERARAVVEAYRQELVPLQERVLALSQQQQNYMLIGTFEVLMVKRDVLQTYQNYISATGDYWIRQVELARMVGGRLPDSAGESGGVAVAVDALSEPEAATNEHSMHDHAHMKTGDAP